MMMDLNDWIALTASLGVVFSPLYYAALKLETHIAQLTTIVQGCPYCTRQFEKENKKK